MGCGITGIAMSATGAIKEGCKMRVYIKYEPAEFAHPEDMKKIVSYLREHGSLQVSETTVESLYREFSATYAAGWLNATDEFVEAFADWLNEIEL